MSYSRWGRDQILICSYLWSLKQLQIIKWRQVPHTPRYNHPVFDIQIYPRLPEPVNNPLMTIPNVLKKSVIGGSDVLFRSAGDCTASYR